MAKQTLTALASMGANRLKANFAVQNANITAANANFTELYADLTTAEGEIDTLQSDLTTAEGEIDTLQSDLTTAEGEIDTLQSSLTTAEGEIDTLQAEVLQTSVIVTDATLDLSTPTAGEHTYILNKSDGIVTVTLGDPSGIKSIYHFIAGQAQANVIDQSSGSGFNAAGGDYDTGTFGGAVGDRISVVAAGDKWYVVGNLNVTIGAGS